MKFQQYPLAISILLLLLSLYVPIPTVGLIVSFITVIVLMFNPKQGLMYLLIYFPMRPFIMELNSGLKYVGDLVIICLFIYVLIKNFREIKEFFSNWIFIAGFAAFCLIGAIAAFGSGTSIAAIVFQLRAFLITFLLFFIVKFLKITKKDIITFLWTTVLVATVICIQGIVEKVSLRTLLLPEAWVKMKLAEINRIRIYGLIGNPNVLATYLSFAFFAALYLKKTVEKNRFILTVLSILIFGVFLLTYSRGTFIAFIVGFVFYILFTRNWKFIRSVLLSAIIAVPLVYYPVVTATDYVQQEKTAQKQVKKKSDFKKRLSESVDKKTIKQSMEWGRLYIVIRGFEIYKDNPIIGTGFGTYGDSASYSYGTPIAEKYHLPKDIYSDNQYIQVIVETGALGVLSFAVFILGMVYYLWKQRKTNQYAIPVLVFLIGGSVAGLFYNIWEDKTFTLYYYMMLGLALNLSFKKELIENEQ